MVSEKADKPAFRRPLELEHLEERIAPAGNIVVVDSGGNLTITGDAESNTFTIDDTGLPAGHLRISPTLGTTIEGYGGPVVYTGITGSIKINLGDGNDALTLDGVSVGKNVQIYSGGGQDGVAFTTCTIGGSLTLYDAENIHLTDVGVARNATIMYANGGHDIVHVAGGQVGGNFSITNRGQDVFSDYQFNGANVAGRLTVSNKTGTHGFGDTSTLSIQNTQVGGVQVRGGGGDYAFSFVGSETARGKGGISLSYGVGDVTALIDDSTVIGSVSLKTAGGLAAMAYDTSFTLRNDTIIWDKLTINTGDTDDVVVLDDILVIKGFSINSATGDSAVTINHCGIGLEMNANKPKLYPSTISQTTSGWAFGTDTTTVSVTTSEMGHLNLKLRSQEADISFDRAATHGNVSVNTQGADDVVTFHDFKTLGNVSIKTGGGNDTIRLDEIEMRKGSLSIDSGSGDDDLLMDVGVENALSEYSGPVKIALGSGADFLQLGNPGVGGNSGLYKKTVTLDGGTDVDELFYFNSPNVFEKAPQAKSFEFTH